MGGKVAALRAQYEAGKQGLPAFPGNIPPAPTGGTPRGGAAPAAAAPTAAKGSRSIAAAMSYWHGHPQKAQQVFGTTAPTEPQVVKDIESKGYVPTRP